MNHIILDSFNSDVKEYLCTIEDVIEMELEPVYLDSNYSNVIATKLQNFFKNDEHKFVLKKEQNIDLLINTYVHFY